MPFPLMANARGRSLGGRRPFRAARALSKVQRDVVNCVFLPWAKLTRTHVARSRSVSISPRPARPGSDALVLSPLPFRITVRVIGAFPQRRNWSSRYHSRLRKAVKLGRLRGSFELSLRKPGAGQLRTSPGCRGDPSNKEQENRGRRRIVYERIMTGRAAVCGAHKSATFLRNAEEAAGG